MTNLILLPILLIIFSQLMYWLKPFIKEEDKELYDKTNPCIYYHNKYIGIAFHDITKDARLFGWQFMSDGSDKCFYLCTISITFIFLERRIL